MKLTQGNLLALYLPYEESIISKYFALIVTKPVSAELGRRLAMVAGLFLRLKNNGYIPYQNKTDNEQSPIISQSSEYWMGGCSDKSLFSGMLLLLQ